jgi:hypothetical protein
MIRWLDKVCLRQNLERRILPPKGDTTELHGDERARGDSEMKTTRNILISLGAMLLCVPLLHAQDLSKYRQFSLGTSLAQVSKQVGQQMDQATSIQQSPAAIQQMEWWPVAMNFLAKPEPVQKVIFTFYNGTLYKIVATYDNDATAGLTDSDMTAAISKSYGLATQKTSAVSTTRNPGYGTDATIAQWDDTKYSVTLSREPFLNAFRLVVLTKQMNAQADASITEAAAQARVDAPQKAIDRDKKDAADLETQRQANLKAFRP